MPWIFVHAFTIPANAIDALGHVKNLEAFDLAKEVLGLDIYRPLIDTRHAFISSELRAVFSAAPGFADGAPPRAVPGRPWHAPC